MKLNNETIFIIFSLIIITIMGFAFYIIEYKNIVDIEDVDIEDVYSQTERNKIKNDKKRDELAHEYYKKCNKLVKEYIDKNIKYSINRGQYHFIGQAQPFSKVWSNEYIKDMDCTFQYNKYFKKLILKGYNVYIDNRPSSIVEESPHFSNFEFEQFSNNNQVKEDGYFKISWDK